MNILCKIGLHKWQYKVWHYVWDFYSQNITRHCIRCERIEKSHHLIQSIFPPVYEKVVGR
jgi:hypothetical protein